MTDEDREREQAGGGIGRRGFLLGAGGVVLGGAGGFALGSSGEDDTPGAPEQAAQAPAPTPAAGSATSLPEGTDPADVIAYGYDPLTAETQRDLLTAGVTPAAAMFIRQNVALPDPGILSDPGAWSFRVDGVAEPGEMTLRDLQSMRSTELTAVLQCSGNGRGFADHAPDGEPWRVGAVANVTWTGVPVKAVIEERGGPAAGAAFLTGTGGEPLPADVEREDEVVERSVPLRKGMADCMLVWEMNGEPIPLSHGGPLRLIVPGYHAVNSVKFLKRLACTEAESPAKIQQSSYRVRPVGEASDPSQPSMWEMNVKSLITGPSNRGDVATGMVDVRGFAWSGDPEIEGVEVSTDGGKRWNDAKLSDTGPGQWAWRGFSYTFSAGEGDYRLVSRATDANGAVQPAIPEPNEEGYAHNGWRQAALTIGVG